MKLRLNASSVVVGLAIGALAAGGITYAAANTGGTTINACQSKSTGALRVLTTGTCKTTEVGVSWNSQGPQGAPGDTGQQGVAGPQGAPGSVGPAGRDGLRADPLADVTANLAMPGRWLTSTDTVGNGLLDVSVERGGVRCWNLPARTTVVVHTVLGDRLPQMNYTDQSCADLQDLIIQAGDPDTHPPVPLPVTRVLPPLAYGMPIADTDSDGGALYVRDYSDYSVRLAYVPSN